MSRTGQTAMRLIIAAGLATACAVSLLSCRAGGAAATPPLLQRQTSIEDAAALGIGERFQFPNLIVLDGTSITPQTLFAGRAAVVFAMTSTGCPLSRKYGPRLAAIEREYAARGAAFVYVNTVEAETDEHMREQAREYGFRGKYLPDRDRAVASTFGVRTTTEVFVLDAESRLVYRGAVDDQYGVGTSLPAARNTYLRDALEAVITGQSDALAAKATFAPGCLVDVPRKKTAQTNLTYFGRAAHILAENCIGCHTPGGVAPFSLATYPDIQGRASMIEAVVRDGLMPPSHGNVTTSSGGFASPRQLTSSERKDLLEWLASDRKLGNFADGPPPRVASAEWAIGNGRPDLLYMTPTLRLPADGPLVHKRSVMKLQIEKDEWVHEIEFRPMKPDTVHHALVWILPGSVPAPADDVVIQGLELLGVYSPAQTIVRYPEGVARRLPAGCSLLVDLYAQPMGRSMSSSLRIAMALGQPPREEVKSLVVQKMDLRIAANESHEWEGTEVGPIEDLRVLSVYPNMRARGMSMTVRASGRVGGQLDIPSLLEAPRYDHRWHTRFVFEAPRRIPAGFAIQVSGIFDNSSINANNPNPSQTVRAGPGAQDESLMAVLEVLEPVAAGAAN